MTYICTSNQAADLAQSIQLNAVDYQESDLFNCRPSELRALAGKILGLQSIKWHYLFTEKQQKLEKSNKLGKELNIGMHLAPSNLSGKNTCPMASKGCRAACLNTSGKGRLSVTQIGRIKKTKLYFEHPFLFRALMINEIRAWQDKAEKQGLRLAVRLNTTSDIVWENKFPLLFEIFKNVQFYDYTKIAKRFEHPLPSNYHLTFSRSEENQNLVDRVISRKGNVAVVFQNIQNAMQTGYQGLRVINGVESDRRYADPAGVIVGLQALGNAKADRSGFVVPN